MGSSKDSADLRTKELKMKRSNEPGVSVSQCKLISIKTCLLNINLVFFQLLHWHWNDSDRGHRAVSAARTFDTQPATRLGSPRRVLRHQTDPRRILRHDVIDAQRRDSPVVLLHVVLGELRQLGVISEPENVRLWSPRNLRERMTTYSAKCKYYFCQLRL